jgi:hypothetical protein
VIDSRHLDGLPDVPTLRRLCQSLAMLDAILSPEWAYRYYSFNAHWSAGKMMASMRNGSGDDYYILFNGSGAIIKGYAHEMPLAAYYVQQGVSYPGVLDHVPPEFADFRAEPAFEPQVATFCLWRRTDDRAWQTGPITLPPGTDPDGSAELLGRLDGDPWTYRDWALDYFDLEVPEGWELSLEAVERIYRHEPISEDLVSMLNPDVHLVDLQEDMREIGYPGPS